jgi:Predicted amidophosphoribosyltransferases
MLSSLYTLFFPRRCLVCQRVLLPDERLLCLGCMADLPRSGHWLHAQHTLINQLQELVSVHHASAFLRYTKESPYHTMLHQLKYQGNTQVGELMGRWFGEILITSPWYQDVDMVVPVPLHPKKLRKRGYNQSEVLARGIASGANWILEPHLLTRTRHTATQTKLNKAERQQNVAGAFSLQEPQKAQDKHILLVDDVFTTGATTASCASVLLQALGARVSIATLAYVE